MYTEVGEQMAEQNILNGNQKKLEQIIGDVKEHNTKKDRLEKLAESVKDISKELKDLKDAANDIDRQAALKALVKIFTSRFTYMFIVGAIISAMLHAVQSVDEGGDGEKYSLIMSIE